MVDSKYFEVLYFEVQRNGPRPGTAGSRGRRTPRGRGTPAPAWPAAATGSSAAAAAPTDTAAVMVVTTGSVRRYEPPTSCRHTFPYLPCLVGRIFHEQGVHALRDDLLQLDPLAGLQLLDGGQAEGCEPPGRPLAHKTAHQRGTREWVLKQARRDNVHEK